MASYDTDSRVESIARDLISKHHPHLEDNGAKIAYLIKESAGETKAPRKGKRLKIASVSLVPEKYRILTDKGYHFLVVIDQKIWDCLEHDQQVAVVDHELCHMGWDEDGPFVRDHEVEEFRAVVERHGLYHIPLQSFAEAISQLNLPLEAA
jgi:Putative phage metallopeptidase